MTDPTPADIPSLVAPERIWLLDYGDVSCTWCEDADPDGEHHDSIEYVRADGLPALLDALSPKEDAFAGAGKPIGEDAELIQPPREYEVSGARECICPQGCPMTEDGHWVNCPAHAYYDGYLQIARTPAVGGIPAGMVAVPVEPTEAQWGGLARSIMMWLDFTPHTPRTLFKHLEASGVEIPQWLRDEPEMQHLDHVPSKGTRCVLIYRAMLAAASAYTPQARPTASDGEAAISAAYLAIYGPGRDPFQHPEGWQYATEITDAILAALPTTDGAAVREACAKVADEVAEECDRFLGVSERRASAVWTRRIGAAIRALPIATPPTTDPSERMREANKRLRDGYADAIGGLRYILQHHGRLQGVGFDRVEDHFFQWVEMPEREGLLAGSHDIAALTPTNNEVSDEG